MSDTDDSKVLIPLPIKWAVPLAILAIIVAAMFYLAQFSGYEFSADPEDWGQLGDYMGGLVNPILGLITVVLLVTSLQQNQLALKQAQREIQMSREALDQATEAQIATEKALKNQVEIADESRDLSNAIALREAYALKLTALIKKNGNMTRYMHPKSSGRQATPSPPKEFPGWTRYNNQRLELEAKIDDLDHIVDLEHKRLRSKYPLKKNNNP